ncbi:MAG: N-acetyltransferase [Bacteroidota bacterium]
MNLLIRQETPADYAQVESLIGAAFADVPYSDQSEPQLVARLRQGKEFQPQLSLVATQQEILVGHILFTPILVEGSRQHQGLLALAPVSVLPAFQGQGIGGKLIQRGHEIARELGYRGVVLVGHETYYPRFGYEEAATFGIKVPFEVPSANVMALALSEEGLSGISGTVVYPSAFFG